MGVLDVSFLQFLLVLDALELYGFCNPSFPSLFKKGKASGEDKKRCGQN
jgi:hypothetical protein